MTETGEQIKDNRQALQTGACLDPEWIRQLVDGEASPARIAQIEEHLAICPECRSLLEKESGGAALWDLARRSLSMAVPAGAENDASPGGSSPPDPMLSLLEPSSNPEMLGSLGAYEIAGVLGKGGMGVVLKAYDPALGRYVAIKLLAPHLAANANARKRFAREAKAAAAVAHDHVIAIHGVSEFKGIPYLVMPLIRGESLQKRLRAEGQLPVEVILRIAMQTASGLAAAHAQGLIHRDVKPANILLGPGTERVTLTDFGLARAVDEVDLTVTGMLPGTPRYMSPEQARGEILDARTDLFSLGLVLYEMAAGQSPFRADSSYAVLRKISEAEPKPLADFRTDLPEWLIQIISRLLAKNPLDRLASARDLERLLADGLAHWQAPKSNAAPRLGVLTGVLAQANSPQERAYDSPRTAEATPERQPPVLSPSVTSWFSGRLVAGAALLALIVIFFYPLIKGEAFALTLGLLIVGGLLLFFGPFGLAYRSKAMVAAYSPGRRVLQMGVFGLGVLGVGFLIFQVETQIAKMHMSIWTQTYALQNRHNEWASMKGAIADKEWKKENDLIEYAQSTVANLHLNPGESFSLFAGVAVLAILMLAVWGLSFWKRCHPAWVAAGVGLAVVWGFYALIQAETTVHRVIAESCTPEIWSIIGRQAPPVFADPVVVIADKKSDQIKEIQIHIKPGYVVLGVARNRENGTEIPNLSFWAGQGTSANAPFKLNLQYKIADGSMPMLDKNPWARGRHFVLTGEPKNLNGNMPLGEEGVETVLEGKAHEVWAFSEKDFGNQQKVVPLLQLTWNDPKSPKDAINHWELTLKIARLPTNTLQELGKEFVFKGVHWKEDEWRRELGLDRAWMIGDWNDSGKLIQQELEPNRFVKKGPRVWSITLPRGMVVDLLPVEVDQKSSRPIEMLRGYCYNDSEKTIVFQYALFLDNEPEAPWPKDYPKLISEISSGGLGSEFPAVKTNGNPLWLLARNWIADPQSTRGPVKTAWIKELDQGRLPAYVSFDSGSPKGAIEVRVRYHFISLPAGAGPIGSGIGTPWWKALHMQAPIAKEAAQRDELVDLELSADGANVKVLGLHVPVSVVGPLIAKDGFSKNAGLLLRSSPETPAERVTRAVDTLKGDGYAHIFFAKKEPPLPNTSEMGAKQPNPSRTEIIALKHIAAEDCVRVLDDLLATGNRGGALANSTAKDGRGKRLQLKAVADSRTNSVFIVGPPADLDEVKAMIKQLDAPPATGKPEEKKDSKKDSKKDK